MTDIQRYIASKKLSWSQTTIKSESSRLSRYAHLTQFCPDKIFEQLSKEQRPYTVKTTMLRLAEYMAFKGDFGLKQFIKDHPKLFTNAYVKERLEIDFDEAKTRIQMITDPQIRQAAEELLFSGARAAELLSHKSGKVVGKGGRVRDLFLRNPDIHYSNIEYINLYRTLKAVGLKPHTLRKLAATRMVQMGFAEAELMRVMGWASMATASCYVQSRRDDEIKQRLLNG